MSTTAGRNQTPNLPGDHALARAIRAWGQVESGPEAASPGSIWAKFSPAYRERLAGTWDLAARLTPELAWQTLLRDQRASARFDPARVHPSWYVRILEAESPAVRRLVAEHAPEPIRSAVRGWLDRLGVTHEWPQPPTKDAGVDVNSRAATWALTLWSERLVGDSAALPADPPIIVALSQLSFRDLVRLARVAGLAKQAFALPGARGPVPELDAVGRVSVADRVRFAYFRRIIGRPDPRLVPLARGDLARVEVDRRRKYAAVGLITLARLLKGCDAHRARWAIQHLPYPIARRVGSLGGTPEVAAGGLPPRAVRGWEAWVLEAAWARLLGEGRIGPGRGEVWA